MPKLVKKLNTEGPPYLLDQFTVVDSSDYNKTNYTYTKETAENLRLWVRFDSELSELANYPSIHDITPSYIGSPGKNESLIYNAKTKTATFSDSKNTNAKIVFGDGSGSGNNNILSFTDGSNNDLPFSVGFWVKTSSTSGNEYFFTKGKADDVASYDNAEFFGYYHVGSDKIYLFLIDASGPNLAYAATTTAVEDQIGYALNDGNWHYVFYTYDGTGGPTPATGVKIYVDGIILTTTAGLNPYSSNPSIWEGIERKSDIFYIASTRNPSTELNGSMGELGVWGKVLSIEEIKAIYYASYDKFRLKSGYISKPPRVKIRELDNMFTSRPSVMRTGDKDRTGVFAKKSFNDQNTLIFGKLLSQNFNFNREGLAKDILSSKKWNISNSTCRITNSASLPGFYKFTGFARTLTTANRLPNISDIEFDLAVGYSQASFPWQALRQPNVNDKLLIQWSDTGTVWSTIKEISLYEYRNLDESLLKINNFKLGSEYFAGKYNQGYIRLQQTTAGGFSFNSPVSCALKNIKIKYANETVIPVLGVNISSDSGKNIYSASLMTPHFLNSDSLQVSNKKTFFGAANNFKNEENSELLSPFTENSVINNDDEFFRSRLSLLDEELNEINVPDFSLPVRSKTKITFDLDNTSSSTRRTIGNTTKGSVEDGSSGGFKDAYFYPITYYKAGEKRWDGAFSGLGYFSSFINVDAGESFESSIANNRKLLAFGPLDAVASGSAAVGLTDHDPDKIIYLPEDAISSYVRPIRTFGFPTLGQYTPTVAEDTFKMKNYTNKPFLLERCVLEFEASFEFAQSGDLGENQYGLSWWFDDPSATPDPQPSDRRNYNQHKVIIPTFFILRQKSVPNDFETSISAIIDDNGAQTKIKRIYSGSSGNLAFEGNKTRELVTYGQMTLYASSSSPLTNRLDIDLQEVLDRGLSRDLDYDIMQGQSYDPHAGDSLPSITGSWVMNFPCREVSKTPPAQRMYISGANGFGLASNKNNIYAVLAGDEIGGRGIDELNGNDRSYFRGKQSQKLGDAYETFGTARVDDPLTIYPPKRRSIDIPSPYLLMPDDELIFGWHYPINNDHVFSYRANGDVRANTMRFEVGAKSKLHMYGSLIADKKEYHETLNQPLYTDSIFETVIGGDKIIDQFDINTPTELSGTYIDNYPVLKSTISTTFKIGPITIPISFAIGLAGEELHNLPPENRIDTFLGSLINKRDSYAVADVSATFTQERENAIGQFQKFISCRNEDEIGLDNEFTELFPSYGKQETSKNTKIYTSYRHHGHLSDLYQQRKLVRTSRNPGISPAGQDTMPIVTNYTVQAKFIIRLSPSRFSPSANRNQLALNEIDIIRETYDFRELESVINTTRNDGSVLNIAQSSNTNIHMTSSFPYNDNDLSTEDGKKYRNKNYAVTDANTIYFDVL